MLRSLVAVTARLGLAAVLFILLVDLRVELAAAGAIVPAATRFERPLVVVLGARVLRGGLPSPMLEDRLQTALALQRRNGGELLLSGDGRAGRKDEIRVMRAWLLAHGAPAAGLCADRAGYDTYESLIRVKQSAPGMKVVIVSQRFHLQRALYLAQGMELEAVGVAADSDATGRQRTPGMLYFNLRETGARIKALGQRLTGLRPIVKSRPLAPLPLDCGAEANDPAAASVPSPITAPVSAP